MAAYLLYAITKVTDEEKSAEYVKLVAPTFEQYGAEGVAVRKTVQSLSGEWKPQLLSIFKFENIERLQEWYDSPEYAPAKKLREESRIDDMVAIDAEG